ncbi:MAG: UDP-N-acetylglucosamine 2-epimerase (non-hydrolyzing) [Chloroflexi bacterium]|nr:UDP-N-acetylglucosamine 2-epimerase (non-hydrolyzing) [Chloroflexota bacterium]
MKIVTVLGARPQFIKAAPVCRVFRDAGINETIIHTGQHYDHAMSQVFFDQLGIPAPEVNLGVGSGSHGKQTGAMLAGIEEILLDRRPDRVLVYGDTNSTLAGALAAVKLGVPIAHVEAGLRSFNRSMPEEHNRVVADHVADWLFCPTATAVENLRRENITRGVELVGDTMYDAIMLFTPLAERSTAILQELSLEPNKYILATIHRPSNTDVPEHLAQILMALSSVDEPVVLPVHPRTQARMHADPTIQAIIRHDNLRIVEPVGYLEMLVLTRHARIVATDSGGLQKEAYMCGKPCVTLREETEWVETVQAGWSVLVGPNASRIIAAVTSFQPPIDRPAIFGNGDAAHVIVQALL